MNHTKFVLGTANLGSNYGINNRKQFNQVRSRSIISHAIRGGINTFDTAAEYGRAEELIGATVNSIANPRIVTKIPTRDSYTFEYVSMCLELSLSNLKQEKIYGLMFHDPDIHKKNEMRDISRRLIDTGKIEHLGFSAYTLDSLLDAKQNNPSWTIFQVPENILDQRLVNSIELAEMARAKNIFHVRSVFLQGLLVSRPTELPAKFGIYQQTFRNFHLAAVRLGVNALDLCISYALSISWSSGVIVAAASTSQLDEILNFKFIGIDFHQFETLPRHILDPRRWNELK